MSSESKNWSYASCGDTKVAAGACPYNHRALRVEAETASSTTYHKHARAHYGNNYKENRGVHPRQSPDSGTGRDRKGQKQMKVRDGQKRVLVKYK